MLHQVLISDNNEKLQRRGEIAFISRRIILQERIKLAKSRVSEDNFFLRESKILRAISRYALQSSQCAFSWRHKNVARFEKKKREFV